MEYPKLFKVMEYFFNNPYSEVYLRELAKKVDLSPFAVKKYCDHLLEEGMIFEEKKANLRFFCANTKNNIFRQLKIVYSLNKIKKCGLVYNLVDKIPAVTSIVLFGSTARGEDDFKSDIDLVVIGKKKYLDLSKYENRLNREINIHIFKWNTWKKKSSEDTSFYNDVIIQGIAIYGEKPIIK